ncbi:MAG: SDR family oxidoreductase [Pseudomonadota bacterium]
MTKTALLTGATGGIGSAIAADLHARGYQLTLVDFDAQRLAQMAEIYSTSTMQLLDQTDMSAVEAFCDQMSAPDTRTFDVVILNAGGINIGDLADLPRDRMLWELQINLISNATLIQAFARRMKAAGSGHILVTVSMGALVSLKGSATYSAAKFGLRGLLWGLRDELRPHGVNVTGVYPAGVDTPMLRHEARHGGSALNFINKPGTAQDVANAFMRAIDKPRLEVYVPYSESFLARFTNAFPWLSHYAYPLFERIGERGRKKFLDRIGSED